MGKSLDILSVQSAQMAFEQVYGDTDVTSINIKGDEDLTENVLTSETIRLLYKFLKKHQSIAKQVTIKPRWLIWGLERLKLGLQGYSLRGQALPLESLAIENFSKLSEKALKELNWTLKLWEAYKISTQKRMLSFAGTKLSKHEFDSLFADLGSSSFTILNLSRTNLDDSTFITHISLLLTKVTTELDLSFNLLTDLSATRLLKFLKNNISLNTIKLEGNNIDPRLVDEINQKISDNRQIKNWLENLGDKTTFQLPHNIDDSLIYRVAKMLSYSSAIKELDLNGADLDANQQFLLHAAVLKNFSLHAIKNGTISDELQQYVNYNLKMKAILNKVKWNKNFLLVSTMSFFTTLSLGILAQGLANSLSWSLIAKTIAASLVPTAGIVMLIAPLIAYHRYQSFKNKLPHLKNPYCWNQLAINDEKLGIACKHNYLLWLKPRTWTVAAYLGYYSSSEKPVLTPTVASSSSPTSK